MKKLFLIISILLFLSSCAPSFNSDSPPRRLSDDEIASLTNGQLCAIAPSYVDPRMTEAISKRKLDCDPRNMYCESQSIHKGSKKYASCLKRAEAEFAENSRLENPGYRHCKTMGFDSGTSAMATCLASWSQQQQFSQAMQFQQQQAEQQQRAQAWKNLSDSFQPAPQNRITNTDCQRLGSSVHCTTY